MKKKTIWIIAVIMGISFLGLIYVQVMYMKEMVKMKKEQFDESVNRALYQASRNLEFNETLRYLEKDINEIERKARRDSLSSVKPFSSFELSTVTTKPSQMPKAMILRNDKGTISQASKAMQGMIRNRYVYQKALLDEVVYSLLYSASDKPLRERINFKLLDQDLKAELMNNGINILYHFSVTTQDGREVYRCSDYTDDGEENSYSQILFRNDPQQKMGVVHIHFPNMGSYIFSSVRFMIPALAFSCILLVTFIFTIFIVFRQKKLTEIKNDFINNMTHELKTPISSISLAAQMLGDEAVTKSPQMMSHLGRVVQDESKRLRFLVEKVLQMSMFDRQKAIFKPKELDLNEMVENAAQSFQLRVEHTGGKIYTEIEAIDSALLVDEIHFTNAIFNLMDNAVKYSKPDQPLYIYLRTWNDASHLYLSIRDTGLGMKKEVLRKIWDKFYRAHTGNRHDVKGFGLGLAYVKKIVELHNGKISVESVLGDNVCHTAPDYR